MKGATVNSQELTNKNLGSFKMSSKWINTEMELPNYEPVHRQKRKDRAKRKKKSLPLKNGALKGYVELF